MLPIHRFIDDSESQSTPRRPVTIEVIPCLALGPHVPLRPLEQITLLMCACVPLLSACASI